MKDFIDISFMDLFYPDKLFKDYASRGYSEPIDNHILFFNKTQDETKKVIKQAKLRANTMTPEEAAAELSCDPEKEDFHLKLQILTRMHNSVDFRDPVLQHYTPAFQV